VTVPERPAHGGIDPYKLLNWEEGNNIEEVEGESGGHSSRPRQ
jgi:ABC-2 type transport system permease protein